MYMENMEKRCSLATKIYGNILFYSNDNSSPQFS